MLGLLNSRLRSQRTTYEDSDGARKEEIAALGGGENVFRHAHGAVCPLSKCADAFLRSAFYERLKELRDAHRHFPNVLAPSREEGDSSLVAASPGVEWTGEEGGGRYLDLQEHHRAFVNAPFGAKTDYLSFLDCLPQLAQQVARPRKGSAAYAAFLSALCDALLHFHARAMPLAYIQPQLQQRDAAFEEAWAAGTLPGWEDRGLGLGSPPEGDSPDLDAFSSPEELLSLGGDAVKAALQRLGLKAGGTELQRAQRLFSTKGRRLQDLDRKFFLAGCAPPQDAQAAARATELFHRVARTECRLAALLDVLTDTLQATRGNVEKKTTLSFQELEAERMEEEEDAPEPGDQDQDGDVTYNPLKLPLGWDGKPIPYWLFKLHGLNQEFACEICGNFSYFGRRAYERHFREPRHQHGMRCLKVPNSKAFLEVTTIAEALALHKAITERGAGAFKTEADEEFEDAQGNVYNKKTYLDLQRQGLL